MCSCLQVAACSCMLVWWHWPHPSLLILPITQRKASLIMIMCFEGLWINQTAISICDSLTCHFFFLLRHICLPDTCARCFFLNSANMAVRDVFVMTGVCERMCLCPTCICQAVIGGGVGQHLPAPISAVLDAAVCTFYCKTSLNQYLWINTQMSFTESRK